MKIGFQKKWFIGLVLFSGFALAQGMTGFLSEAALQWAAAVGALGAYGGYLARRFVSLVLERKWKISRWLDEKDRAIGAGFVFGIAYGAFMFQPQILKNAEALAVLPAWESILAVAVITSIVSSGGWDDDQRAARSAPAPAVTVSVSGSDTAAVGAIQPLKGGNL